MNQGQGLGVPAEPNFVLTGGLLRREGKGRAASFDRGGGLQLAMPRTKAEVDKGGWVGGGGGTVH